MDDTSHETPREAPAGDWYASAFNALYPVVYAHRTVDAAAPESAFAAARLGLRAEDRVLDLCCGNGRHMVHLLRHTPQVYGLDYSAELLAMARRTLGGAGCLVRGDMRELPFNGGFDVVTNFFTSFGYFPSTEENLRVVLSLARALKPGGRVFVDYLNPAHVAAHLVPRTEREESGYCIVEERWIDTERRRVNKVMRVTRGGERIMESSESVRLYEAEEMTWLLAQGGIEIEAAFGDYEGARPGPERPRLILVGRRHDSGKPANTP